MILGCRLVPKGLNIGIYPGIRIINLITGTYLRSPSQVFNDFRTALSVSPDILDDMVCGIFCLIFHDSHECYPLYIVVE